MDSASARSRAVVQNITESAHAVKDRLLGCFIVCGPVRRRDHSVPNSQRLDCPISGVDGHIPWNSRSIACWLCVFYTSCSEGLYSISKVSIARDPITSAMLSFADRPLWRIRCGLVPVRFWRPILPKQTFKGASGHDRIAPMARHGEPLQNGNDVILQII